MRITTARLIPLVLMALWPFEAYCIDPSVTFDQNVIQTWGVDQGLPQATVTAVVQTADGYVWGATQEGFVRFDGSTFALYDKAASSEIHSNFTLGLLPARDGSLYATTNGGGLVQVDRGGIHSFTTANGLPSNQATALLQTTDGSIWIGTQKGLARRFPDGHIAVAVFGDRLPDPSVTTLAEDWTGQLWIGTMKGIVTLQNGQLTRHDGDGFPTDFIISLCPTRDGSMWIGTHDHGLLRYRAGKFRAYTEADGLPSKTISAIYEDRHGTMWIGTLDHGFGQFKDEQFNFNLQAAGIGNKAVSSFLEDREDNLWVGSAMGLTRIAEPKVLTFSTAQGLLANNVRSVYGDASGTLWVATGKGVQSLDGSRRFSKEETGLPSNRVMSLGGSRDGSLWIGTWDAGLQRVSNGKVTSYNTSNGLLNNFVLATYEDRAGVVWVGTARGLQKIVDGAIAPDSPKLSGKAVGVIYEDHNGAIWAGTQDGGLNRISGGNVTSFTTQSGLASDVILTLFEDRDGAMWVGTLGGGLSRFKNNKWSTITGRDGLYDDNVMAILEDEDGFFWMSSNKGIFRVSRQQLNDFADGTQTRVSCIVYGKADGMRNRECNGGSQPGAWKTADGKMWFATVDGVACVDPKNVRVAAAPPLILEGMFADRHRIDWTRSRPLDAGTKAIEFHYSGINFSAPSKVHYQYKLEGFDKEWVDAGSARVAYYMNLKPGSYRFYVRAATADGPWNTVSTTFKQRPFVYQSPWFLATSVVFLFGVAGIAHRSRVKVAVTSAERFKLLFDRNLAAEYRATEEGGVLDCNDACAKMFGFQSRAELMANGVANIYWSDEDREAMFARLRTHGTLNNYEISLRRADETVVSVLMNATLTRDAGGHEIIEATLVDISERKRAEEEIQYKAHHDVLTGLPNRSLFNDRLNIALNYAHRQRNQLAVLCLDLDSFNVVNDAFGRAGGDGVLKTIAERLTSCVREEDSVARVGDDEFTLLLMNPATVNDVTMVARKILQTVARPITIDGHQFNITTSIGIALYPQDGQEAETLLTNANSTLYRAKEAGRNSYRLCSPVLARKAADRLSLENALREAMEQQEFLLHYQPQLDTRTQKVTGMEALLRWNRPGKGIVRPAEFIGVAEETRLIVPIGEWALEEACRQGKIWHEQGAAMRMSVNVSPHQFQQPNIVSAISDAITRTGFDPHALEIEITESTAMQNPDFTADVLRELKNMGMTIAIDDFGVGHSSLNYLKRFPIDALKIDRSFVQDITRGGSDGAIVSAVIAMARALKIRVIAEGVETEEQFDFLRENGCYEFQGYLFGRPLPVEALADMVRKAIPDTYTFERGYRQPLLAVPDVDH